MFLLFFDNWERHLKYYFYSSLENCVDNLNSIFIKHRYYNMTLYITFKTIYLDSDTKNETDETLTIIYYFNDGNNKESLFINDEEYDYIPNSFTLEFLNENFSKHNFSVDAEPVLW